MKQAHPPETTVRYDTVVLAGDRKASRKVKGKNKSLLVINQRPVICYIVEALAGSRYTNDIYVVGPKERLTQALASRSPNTYGKKVVVLEQWDNLFENAWNGFLHTIPGYDSSVSLDSYRDTPHWTKVVLALSGDIPLLTPFEVDEFFEKADFDRYDYQPGITRDTSLKYYYPRWKKGRKKKKGIKHAYFHFREGLFRQNNMHLARPFAIANKIYVEKMYEYRHQREWKDIVQLAWEIIRTEKESWKSLLYFAILQSSLLLTGMGLNKLSERLRRRVSLYEDVEPAVGMVLGTRLKTVETTYGGAALDIDNDYEFDAIKANFEDWMTHQKEGNNKGRNR